MRPNVVILGEAPGKEEDRHGRPFIGPSGKILQSILDLLSQKYGKRFRPLVSNTIGCAPKRDCGKIGTPSDQEVAACLPWVKQLLTICQPQLVVSLGIVANDSYEMNLITEFDFPQIHVYHPAFILRTGGVKSRYYSLAIQKISEAVEVHCGVEESKTQ